MRTYSAASANLSSLITEINRLDYAFMRRLSKMGEIKCIVENHALTNCIILNLMIFNKYFINQVKVFKLKSDMYFPDTILREAHENKICKYIFMVSA